MANPKYRHKEEIIDKIDAYFEDCKGVLATDDNGEPIVTKYGPVYLKQPRPPTTSGLALALGFTSRQSLLNYKAKKEFTDVIELAKLRIEQYTEERLFDKDGANGAKFSLQNNFRGWNEAAKEQAAAASAAAVTIINDIPRPGAGREAQTDAETE